MEKEEMVEQFSELVIRIAALEHLLQDAFFVRRLRMKLEIFVRAFLQFSLSDREDRTPINVAQYYSARVEILRAIDALTDEIEHFQHATKSVASPLLHAHLALAHFKLLLMRTTRPEEKGKQEERPISSKNSPLSGHSRRQSPRVKTRLNANQEKILSFVKTSHDARAKDIVDQFSILLSERTVKRNLKDLVHLGVLRKRSENKAVFYSVVEA